jgi:hypothetical protein
MSHVPNSANFATNVFPHSSLDITSARRPTTRRTFTNYLFYTLNALHSLKSDTKDPAAAWDPGMSSAPANHSLAVPTKLAP